MRAVARKGLVFNTEWPQPSAPGPGETMLRVRVHAAAINPVDYKLPAMIGGSTTGLDFAGEVQDVYNDSSNDTGEEAKYKLGDKVYGTWKGALSDYIVVPPGRVAHMPEDFSFVDA